MRRDHEYHFNNKQSGERQRRKKQKEGRTKEKQQANPSSLIDAFSSRAKESAPDVAELPKDSHSTVHLNLHVNE